MHLAPWSTSAVNLADHADNPVHTDVGARAEGFPSALVAGVTVYHYMTHVPVAGWGIDWLREGGAQVRFRSPVFADEMVDYIPTADSSGDVVVGATVDGQVRATCSVSRLGAHPERCTGDGEPLDPMRFVPDESWNTYARRAGDDPALYGEHAIVHPVTWMRIANEFFHTQVVAGPWIHVRSDLHHVGLAQQGSVIEATAKIVDRFDSRAGKRAILDVRISADGAPVAVYEHEAIIEVSVGD